VGDVTVDEDVDSLPDVEGVGGPIFLLEDNELIGARSGDTV
jgi:hypothetical protein